MTDTELRELAERFGRTLVIMPGGISTDWRFDLQGLLALVETVLAQPEPQGWRPIETAPKDGTGFDVWVKSTKNASYGVRMTNVYFSQGVICGARYPDASFGEVATHWMPLPEAPKENSNG